MSLTSPPSAAPLSATAGLDLLLVRAKQRLTRVPGDVWLIALAGLLAWASFAFGERIAIRDGLGWEGEMYWNWVKDLRHEVFDVGIDAYCIQRILPSAILHYSFRLFHVQPTIVNTLRGFATLNLLSIMAVAYFWCATANHLRISTRGKWLGFIGLFLNYAVLKCSGYYVVMTDMPAFASGAAMAYCYLTRRRVGLWAATIVGAMLWPTQLYIGTVLSLFPKRSATDGTNSRPADITGPTAIRPSPWHLNIILAGLAGLYWLLWSSYACNRIQIPLWGGLWPIKSLLTLSLAISGVWVVLALKSLLNDRQLYRLPTRVSLNWTVGAIVTLLVAVGVKGGLQWLSTRPGYMGLPVYAYTIGISAVAKPGLFIVSHLVYYGPFWMLAAVFWPSICREIQRQHGLGLVLVTAIGVCHALDAESRHLIYLLPLMMPFVVRAIDRKIEWTTANMLALATLCVLASKCWLIVGGPFTDNANLFPDQYYWMNVGAFMADQTYLWQLAACAIAAVIVYHGYLRNRRSAASLAAYNQAALEALHDQFAVVGHDSSDSLADGPGTLEWIRGLPIIKRMFGQNARPADGGNRLLPALTGVRAMAAYLVFLHHFPPKLEKVGPFVWGALSEGHIGVTMFFVLSGFLIAYRYQGKLQLNAADLKTYFWNRFARIYPLYFLLLIPTLILAHEHRFGRWFVEMTLLKGFFDEYKFAGIGQAWSLTAEECFYLSAPLLMLCLRSRYRVLTLPACYAVGLALLGVGSAVHYHEFFGNPRFLCGYTFFGRALEFLVGAWMAMNLERLQVFKSVPGKTYLGLAGMFAGLVIFDGLKSPAYALGVLSPGGVLMNNVFMPFAIGLFYLGLIQDQSWLRRLLSTRVLQLLGKSSYAFYLIHLGFISQYFAPKLSGVWFFLALVGTAIVLFKVVEEPLNHLLRSIGPGRAKLPHVDRTVGANLEPERKAA